MGGVRDFAAAIRLKRLAEAAAGGDAVYAGSVKVQESNGRQTTTTIPTELREQLRLEKGESVHLFYLGRYNAFLSIPDTEGREAAEKVVADLEVEAERRDRELDEPGGDTDGTD